MNLRTNLKINCATCGARLFLVGLGLVGTAGCRGRVPAEANAATRPQASGPAQPAFALVGGTPPGGLRAWIGDVRRGLKPIPAEAVRDPAGAQRAALELYLTRQEYIEMYWGVVGKLTRGPALGPAVKEAETRFHRVLAELQPAGPGQAAQPTVLGRDIASLGAQYDRVIAEAEKAGVPLDPHSLVKAAGVPAAAAAGNRP